MMKENIYQRTGSVVKTVNRLKKGILPPLRGKNNTFEKQHADSLPQHGPILLSGYSIEKPAEFVNRRE